MTTTRSASRAASESVSAAEQASTLSTPSSKHALMIRTAISPRLGMRSRRIPGISALRPDGDQGGPELDTLGVVYVDGGDHAGDLGGDVAHQLHHLDDPDRVPHGDPAADLDEGRGARLRCPPEDAHARCGHLDVAVGGS